MSLFMPDTAVLLVAGVVYWSGSVVSDVASVAGEAQGSWLIVWSWMRMPFLVET
jgi:hypothetical protein